MTLKDEAIVLFAGFFLSELADDPIAIIEMMKREGYDPESVIRIAKEITKT